MLRLALITTCAVGCVLAQQKPGSDAERVTAALQAADPLVDGKTATELLAPESLDDAIRAVAGAAATEPAVRLRALRVARALDLAALLRNQRAPRDLSWWLALHELGNDAGEVASASLLKRAFADGDARAKAVVELGDATEVARRFCSEWSEVRLAGDAKDYAALEAELKAASPACIPALLGILAVPPQIAFSGPRAGQPVDARQQVKALLGLASVLELGRAMPFFAMHTSGTSLTLASNAAQAVQRFSGEEFGAAFMNEGDAARLLAWWKEHKAEHRAVLDHLVHAVARWARNDMERPTKGPAEGVWCALLSLNRALGDAADPPRGASAAELRAQLDALELAWLAERK
ncbi:MAG TPA: hypothetical protein VF384_15055 [Planctomycetota bacterium]